jgi:hypothetical protein
LTNSIGTVHETVDGIGRNLEGVSDTLTRSMVGMEEANQRLASAMASLAPVLTQLSGPMELRLMPAGRGPQETAGDAGAEGAPATGDSRGTAPSRKERGPGA